MQIDPKTLKVVTVQDLVKDGIDPHIAAVRAEHLMEKRSKRLEMLENTIKSGMLSQLITVMDAV